MVKRVAFQGERGSFAEEAAGEFFAGDSEIVACPHLDDLHGVIENKRADYAVLPVENSLIGRVAVTNDFLAAHRWREVGELFLPVRLYLIGTADSSFEALQTIESHPAALAQCSELFRQNPRFRAVESDNTAASVRAAVEAGDKRRGAIGSRQAAVNFDGKILRADVQNRQENYTRFLLLRK